ncbi:MAG TPA: transposase [Verrucomicrobiae bacterium]|nr:transposase [Verrucomicrobiae bacterium]
MPDDLKPLPTRRSVRLKGIDYGHPGACFLTICAHESRHIFGKVIGAAVTLNRLGVAAEECWLDIPNHFPHVLLSEHVVMPNHVHGILVLTRKLPTRPNRHEEMDRPGYAAPGHEFGKALRGNIPTIVRSFKAAVSKKIREIRCEPEFCVRQRGYYEHLIRNPADFRESAKYIRLNPARWAQKSQAMESEP